MKEIVYKEPPDTCPYCGSWNITGERFEFIGGDSTVIQKVDCHNCKRYWYDVYNFDSVQIPEEFDGDI